MLPQLHHQLAAAAWACCCMGAHPAQLPHCRMAAATKRCAPPPTSNCGAVAMRQHQSSPRPHGRAALAPPPVVVAKATGGDDLVAQVAGRTHDLVDGPAKEGTHSDAAVHAQGRTEDCRGCWGVGGMARRLQALPLQAPQHPQAGCWADAADPRAIQPSQLSPVATPASAHQKKMFSAKGQ